MPARHVDGLGVRELESLQRMYAGAGIRIDSFHLPFTDRDDVASFYETERRQAVDRMCYWLERMPALQVRVAVLHPGTKRYSVDVEGLDASLRQLGRSLDTLLPIAESSGVKIALENMPPGPDGGRLGSRSEHFERFAAESAHGSLGFCLDTGHALVAVGPERAGAFLEAMNPHLLGFHLADNAGDRDSHLSPGRGLVDWGQFFRQMVQLGFCDGVCVEAPPFAPADATDAMKYRPEAWRQQFADLDELVRLSLALRC